MTAQHTEDPFAPTDSRPSVSFKNVPPGTTYVLEVASAPSMVQARDFDTRELDFWPDGNPKMTVVTNVVDKATGEEKSLWAPKPSSMFTAIQTAQQTAGAQIAVGGTLQVTFTHEVPVEGKPHLNPAKQYQVVYTPPNAFAPPTQAPVQQAPPTAPPSWAGQQQPAPAPVPQAPVQQPAPVPQAPVQQPAPVPQPPAPGVPDAAQLAALQAAGITDPAQIRTIYPGYQG